MVDKNPCSSPERRRAGESWRDSVWTEDNCKRGHFEIFAPESTLARAATQRMWQPQIQTRFTGWICKEARVNTWRGYPTQLNSARSRLTNAVKKYSSRTWLEE